MSTSHPYTVRAEVDVEATSIREAAEAGVDDLAEHLRRRRVHVVTVIDTAGGETVVDLDDPVSGQ
jgi:hypothetical protein